MDYVLSAAALADIIDHFRGTLAHPVRSGVFLDPVELVCHTGCSFFVHRPFFRFFDENLGCVNSQSGRIDVDTLAFL